MVAWIVNSRLRPRGTPRYHPRFQCHFGSHLSLISKQSAPFFSYAYVEPISQPVCFHIHVWNGGTPIPLESESQPNRCGECHVVKTDVRYGSIRLA